MRFLETLVHQDSTEGYKSNDFLIKFSSSWRKHEVETLKEEIKSVVMGKTGFHNWEESMLKSTFWLFWTNRSQLQGKEGIVKTTITPQKQKLFDFNNGGGHEACS